MRDWKQIQEEIRRDPLYRRVLAAVRRHGMLDGAESVVAGLSGGADSVCMTAVLCAMQEEMGFRLRALHVQHGLRESAEEDLAFSGRLCESLGIAFDIARVDVRALMKERGIGTEEAARILRHEALSAVCPEGSSGRIALAHHLEDQAETILFHLIRGSSLRGLAGMRPCAGTIIRPLFYERREEIEEFLLRFGLSWRTDETNSDPGYSRNFLRTRVIPLLEEVNPRAQEHLLQAGEEASEAEIFLEEAAAEAARRCVLPDGSVNIGKLRGEKRLLQKRVLYDLLSEAAGGRKDLGDKHVEALLALCGDETDGTKKAALPGGVTGVRSYNRLFLARGEVLTSDTGRWPLQSAEYTMEVLPFDRTSCAIPQKAYTKWFDYDKIASFPLTSLELRTRRKGDRITVTDDGRTKSLARYMIDEKIPGYVRDRLVLPAVGNEILWIPGFRMNAAYKVKEGTRQVLQISWHPEGSTN